MEITLKIKDDERLSQLASAKGLKPEQFAKVAAEALLKEAVAGGVMIPAIKAEYIANLIKDKPTVEEIITRVEKGIETSERVYCDIDPSLIVPLKELAATQGVTWEQFIQDAWQTIAAMGWLYQIDHMGQWFFVGNAELDKIRKALGKAELVTTDLTTSIIGVEEEVTV